MSDDSTVIIKPDAYYKMLVHVLRFGAKTRNRHEYKEVMGMLIGRLEGEGTIKDVIIEDAVPVSHGGSIEVRFAPEDYVTFSMIDEKFAKKNWFTVGWYHSHPALDIFFSSIDIRNQLGWQTANPSAIGIVFDHTYLERPGDLGFRTFRLDDPSKGESSGYHEVKTEVEAPDKMEFYNRMIELISSIHTKEPPILELNEKTNLFGEIVFPSDGELMNRMPEIDSNRILNSIRTGLFDIIDSLLGPIITYYNTWSQNMLTKVSNQNLNVKRNLVNLKSIINNQLNDIQEKFNNKLRDFFNDLEFYIDDKFDGIDTKVEVIETSLQKLEETLITEIEKALEVQIKRNFENFNEIYQPTLKNFENTKENLLKMEEVVGKQENFIRELLKQPKKSQELLLNEIKNYLSNKDKDFENKYEILYDNIKEAEKRAEKVQSKLSDALSILQSSVEPLEEKINDLNTEKKVLQNKIDKANSELNEKKKHIESLENENKHLKDETKKERKEKEKLLNKIKKLEKEVNRNE